MSKELATPVAKVRRIKKEAASSMDERHTRNQHFITQQKCQTKTSSNNLLTISKCIDVNFLNLCVEREAIKRAGPQNNRDVSPRILQITKVKMARRPPGN